MSFFFKFSCDFTSKVCTFNAGTSATQDGQNKAKNLRLALPP